MNYYSPYFGYTPSYINPTNKGILNGLLGGVKGINWSNILSNIQKTLGIVNQTIPMVRQISPIMNNAKTMFRVMNEFKRIETPRQQNNNFTEPVQVTNNSFTQTTNTPTYSNNGPIFFQ